jgi:PEP-CTERM motif-containing protein
MRNLYPELIAVAIALSATAHAATLSIDADKTIYAPGEIVTLTVIGDSEGATDNGLFGQILFDPNGLLDASAITFTPQSGGPAGWLAGVHGCLDPGACVLINYIENELGQGASMDPTEQTLAIVTATAGAPGLYTVEWSVEEAWHRDPLDFFGLTYGPGATLVIFNTSFQVIPEPSTMLLLVLGLIALGARRGRAD